MALSPLPSPFSLFASLLSQAQLADAENHNAFVLATVDNAQKPHARVLLLKDFDETGFVFFTNTLSSKGEQLAHNPHAAMCFWWPSLAQQVRIEGPLSPVANAEAEAYFASRPRLSQEGAWASLQSQPLPNRQTLLLRLAQTQFLHAQKTVPRPPHWSGYRLSPLYFEFWKSCPGRLHERLCFQKQDNLWKTLSLYP